ncbi:unnamed protein product [Durusdinium trenchii]|uniref:ANK_REP_REGION domain-containing protein n=2 Tax=Durusdinium trenchii TaxID=1381693 RepID=A0ABP0P1I2_9DINO
MALDAETHSFGALQKKSNEWPQREMQWRHKLEHLQRFLARHGFSDEHRPRKVGSGRDMRIKMECIYPIHVAAQLNDTYTMRILLDMRVDPQTGASGGRTAMDVAQEADQDGSHAPVLRLLLLSEHVKSVSL